MLLLRRFAFVCFSILLGGFLMMPKAEAAIIVKSVSFQDLDHIVIQFNQPILANTAQDKNHYFLKDLNTKHPVITDMLTLQESTYSVEENTVTLWISGAIVQVGESYELHVANLKDNQGKILEPETFTFIQGNISEPAFIDISFSKQSLILPEDAFTLINVVALDTNREPVPNIPIGFEIISGEGELSKVGTDTTGEDGKVIATYIPEEKEATHMIRAFVKSNPNISTANSIEVQVKGQRSEVKNIASTEHLQPLHSEIQPLNSQNSDPRPQTLEEAVLGASDNLPQTGIPILFYSLPALFGAFLIEKRQRKKLQ